MRAHGRNQQQTTPCALFLHLLRRQLRSEECPIDLYSVNIGIANVDDGDKHTLMSITFLTVFQSCSRNGPSGAIPAAVTLWTSQQATP
jgi:hypothetical protein